MVARELGAGDRETAFKRKKVYWPGTVWFCWISPFHWPDPERLPHKREGYPLIRCLSSKSELSQPPTGRQVSQYGIKKKPFFRCMLLHQLLQQPIYFLMDFCSFSYYPAKRFGCLT